MKHPEVQNWTVLGTQLFPVLAQKVETAWRRHWARPQTVFGEARDMDILDTRSQFILFNSPSGLSGPVPPEKAIPVDSPGSVREQNFLPAAWLPGGSSFSLLGLRLDLLPFALTCLPD